MSQGPLCPNLTKKGQAEVSQMANRNLSRVILLGGLSVNLNHLKIKIQMAENRCLTFWTCVKSTLNSPPNGPQVTYSKMQNMLSRAP